jgi:hypothetical protein
VLQGKFVAIERDMLWIYFAGRVTLSVNVQSALISNNRA